MQSVLIQMNDAGWNLRLESSNCKVACLPVGLLKKIVVLYLRGRQNGAKVLKKENATRNVLNSSLSASPPKESEANVSDNIAKDNQQLLGEAPNQQKKTEINILQDTYVINGTTDLEGDAEIKLFMVETQNGISALNIIHMQFRDNTWIDIIVNSEYELDINAQNPLLIEKNYLFQLQLCCEDQAYCTCPDKLKKIIWRREENVCLNEIALKRKPPPYRPELGYVMVDHTCNSKCEELVPILYLQLIPIASAVPDEFELSILSSKKVKDLSDAVYTVNPMYYIEVCYGELKWQARRRYNDFARLHYGLYSEMKIVLPTFPPKTWLRNVDEDFVQDRKVALNDYLQRIVSMPDVIESVSFLSFVGALSTTWFEHNRLSGVARDTIHIRILNHVVDAGDIILFRSKNAVSSVQRTITGAEWDHVGMIIEVPNSRQRYQILEATGDGVTLYPLIPRLLAYFPCFTSYMALRKLRIPPTMERFELRDRLLEFSQRVEGKPYIMTIGKLVNQEESNAKLSGFFCSELIAAALKYVGLMHTDLASSCFWPGCFSTGGQVDKELNYRGAYYEPETIIDCRVLEVSMTNRSRFRGTIFTSTKN
ncbi:ribonuclease H2 subunit A [Thraustotheca clavata]|uniref:Ribonuclease H2 subunit A n=1 Tax=Thraustotheca clavata TaxID=74557 RepID=A0A1W0A5D4_9STRA|nr:ribonuclease H2 subunit A [Thraustotheca clavata]